MKRVAMFVYGPLWPIAMGSQRVIVEMARYISSLPGVSLKIVTVATPQHENEYRQICDEVVFIAPLGRWSFWNVLNKVVSRLGIDIWSVFFTSCAYSKQVRKAVCGCEYVFLNYAIWKNLLRPETITSRTMAITHDLLFYRRASFAKMHGIFPSLLQWINKKLEMRLLRKFNKVGVFADYEQELLLKEGLGEASIVRLGMPISVRRSDGGEKEFDFIFVGGDSYQNEAGVKCFLERVVPVCGREVSFAVAGGICNSSFWESLEIPDTVKIIKLGYVDDLPKTLARGLIGVGTVPYGSGIKVKVVESIMAGLPMVITRSGEEGVPVLRDAVVNIDVDEKSDQEVKLNRWLSDREYAVRIGAKGADALNAVFAPTVALRGIASLLMGCSAEESTVKIQ